MLVARQEKCRAALTCDTGKRNFDMNELALRPPGRNSDLAPFQSLGSAARKALVAVFVARAEARAILWAACEMDLHGAVDGLQEDAEESGLVAGLGQDAVQRILADAFGSVRGAVTYPSRAEMNWDAGWAEAAREYHDRRRAHQRVAA
jgi:hypothetical protein